MFTAIVGDLTIQMLVIVGDDIARPESCLPEKKGACRGEEKQKENNTLHHFSTLMMHKYKLQIIFTMI